jgi:hypothetical protein
MARVAVLALPEILGEIVEKAGRRLPHVQAARFICTDDLLEAVSTGDFNASIISSPDIPMSELIAALHALDDNLFIVVVNGHDVPPGNNRVHVMKLASNTAEEAMNVILKNCGAA